MSLVKPAAQLENVSYLYEGSGRPALSGISFTAERGQWIAVAGPGGSGKSTLCALLSGVLQAWPQGSLSGRIFMNGQDISNRSLSAGAGEVGAVFHDPETGIVLEIVEDELAFGPENMQVSPADIEQRIDEALTAVDLPWARLARTNELSGGQKQRIAIASMLTMRPSVLVLDDATANLDIPSTQRWMVTLRKLRDQGHTIVMASPRILEEAVPDRLIVLHEGQLLLEGDYTELLAANRPLLVELGCLPSERIEPVGADHVTGKSAEAAEEGGSAELRDSAKDGANDVPHDTAETNDNARFRKAVKGGANVELQADEGANSTRSRKSDDDVDRRANPREAAAASSEAVVQVNRLSFHYGNSEPAASGRSQPVLRNVSLSLYPGDFVAVLGPNGSGKTTLGKLLSGQLPASPGAILMHGRDIRSYTGQQLAETVGYLFQNPEHQFVADTVLEECLFGLYHKQRYSSRHRLTGQTAEEQREPDLSEVIRWLQQYELYELKDRNPYQLSDAEKKIVNLVSVMIAEPDIIILDEPTAGLDYTSANRLMACCADYAQKGKVIVMITHDLPTVRRWATKTIRME